MSDGQTKTDRSGAGLSTSLSKALLDMLAGNDDGNQTSDMMRLAAEFLDDAGFGGPLAGKLRDKATRIDGFLSNARLDGQENMLTTDIAELDSLTIPMDIVVKGQDELALDYIEIADYMQNRGFPPEQINKCFSVWAGREVVVCKPNDKREVRT